MQLNFPVGFYDFHKDTEINFQMNRWYTCGIVSYEKMMEIGQQVTGFDVWMKIFTKLAREAEERGDYEVSATYYRATQFFALGDAKAEDGKLLKLSLYDKCFEMYQKAYANEDHYEYERVPYKQKYLPVIKLLHRHSISAIKNSSNNEEIVDNKEMCVKGTIVVHGGYDSFMQEFYRYLLYMFQAGYDVYMFEGPGQGEVLCRCNIKMTPIWEKCVHTVLDYYDLKDVTLIGISLGGYLATRAAAYEPRIKRLVMFDLIYDFYGALLKKIPPKRQKFMNYMVEHPRNILWGPITKKMNQIFFLNWLFGQGYFIYENVHTPCEYFNCIKQYNTRDISKKITQDVLILAGEADIYTVFLDEQKKALENAKSVKTRVFTKEESADHHCQIGNTKLVLDEILTWIESVS